MSSAKVETMTNVGQKKVGQKIGQKADQMVAHFLGQKVVGQMVEG